MAEEEKKKAAPKKAAPKKAAAKAEEKKPAAAKKPAAKKAAPKAEEKAPAKTAEAEKKVAKEEKKAEKAVVPEKAKPTEARCIATGVRVTPRKVRLVCDVVRGKDVDEALAILARLNKAASAPVYKALASAAANATNNFGMNREKLYVAEIQAADGFRIKRFTPRAKGSASPLIRRNTNLRVVVKERD